MGRRGEGVVQFGPDVTEEFLKLNGLQKLIRSHEVKPDGYESTHQNANGDALLFTVFSASNYCGKVGNNGTPRAVTTVGTQR